MLRDIMQSIGATVCVLIAGHLLLGLFLPSGPKPVDPRSKSPVYADYEHKVAFWTEHKQAWEKFFEPYYHWRRGPFNGTYTNIDDEGIRKTLPEVDATAARKTIAVLGGSTIWGTGVPDDGTIPSHLQTMLGSDYRVINYGESGYTSTQELNYLLYLLAQGTVPDVVIFYDGVNDGYAGAYSPAVPRDPENLREDYKARKALSKRPYILNTILESNYGKWVKHVTRKRGKEKFAAWDNNIAPVIAERAPVVIDMYEAHIKQAKALADAYGFQVYFFWQPHLFSMTRESGDYEKKIIARASEVLIESQRLVYEQAKTRFSNRESDGIYFLGNIFDDVPAPIYIDWHHLGSNGNEIIARSMLEKCNLRFESAVIGG